MPKIEIINIFLLTLICLLIITGVTSCADYRQADKQVVTVEKVDLKRYTGKWFEIARFPHSYEKGCVGVTAEYKIINTDSVSVRNNCHKETLDGEESHIEGVAKITEGSGGAKLKVRFDKFPVNLFPGDYWVVMLDDNYKWAVVSDATGGSLWILSRNAYMKKAVYDKIINKLNEKGFKTEYLIRSSTEKF